MQRIPEPELMEDEAQARAYARADFEEPHSHFLRLFREHFPDWRARGTVLDLGCGPADITLRFARGFPACHLLGVDGARAMLEYGRQAVAAAGLESRVTLVQARLPAEEVPGRAYAAVISNSLLHHLADPGVLWEAIRCHAAAGSPVFVMDLRRPESKAAARRLQQQYAAGEPAILQRDFYHSLLAAYTPVEIEAQLAAAQLPFRVRVVSDRHLVISGIMP